MTTEAAAVARADLMRDEVRAGLARAQKEISPKFFYDTRGSELFEQITELPEYYPSRTERALLERCAPEWIGALGIRTLLELGAGSAAKTRILLDAMRAAGTGKVFVPVDVSAEFLRANADAVRAEYPGIRVVPVVGDIGEPFEFPDALPRPVLYAFLGGTIGNFAPEDAVALLERVRGEMRPPDRFLLGVDLRKDVARVEAAYNDSQGVTAEFNRNVLRVLNRELGADFQPDAFQHRAFYNADAHRIEMHLVSVRPQRVTIPEIGDLEFREGETIRTEISCKHDRPSVDAMFSAAGLRTTRWETDGEALYALILAAPAE